MAEKIRVVHYLNQFFAQIGGEEKADIGPGFKEGPWVPAGRSSKRWDRRAKSSLPAFAATTTSPNIWKKLRRAASPNGEFQTPTAHRGTCLRKRALRRRLRRHWPRSPRAAEHSCGGRHGCRKRGTGLYRKKVYIVDSGSSVVRMAPVLQRMTALG